MVALENLTFTYSRDSLAPAVDHVSTAVPEGITLLLGENGAGKTTLLRLMAGLLIPQEGLVEFDGDPSRNPALRLPSLQSRLFFLPDDMQLPRRSVNAFARDFGCLYPRFSSETFQANLEAFSLTGDERIETLSLGNRHKSLLAFALALDVDLLLLDEPANGLDITSKNTLRRLMASCVNPDRNVIISTHTVGDLRELYDGIMVMSHGQVILSKPSWEVSEKLAFAISDIPPRDSLFFEQRAGRFHSIRPIGESSGGDTEIDYPLLYTALLSASREEILNLLHK